MRKIGEEEKELREMFYTETSEMLQNLEQDILTLEEKKHDKELINGVFRGMHSIKGSASFVGFMEISSFAHILENILDMVRNGDLNIDGELVNVLLKAVDTIKHMLEYPEDEQVKADEQVQAMIEKLKHYVPEIEGQSEKTEQEQKERYYKIKLEFDQNIIETGLDPLVLIDELETKGEIVDCNVNVSNLPDIYNLDPHVLYLKWTIKIKTKEPKKEIEDIFIFVMEDNNIEIEEVGEEELKSEDKRLGEMLIDKGLVEEKDLQEALNKQSRIGEILVEEGKLTEPQLNKVVEEQQEMRKTQESSSIRVDTQKLDKLMNLVGELVINQSRVAQIASKKEELNVAELGTVSETLDRITRDIQDQLMKSRMVPIESTFNQFKRMVRDLSIEFDKEVNLEIKGQETELDKTLIELIRDPLKHMIRNAMDHGIETKEERIALEKSEQATILLNAYHEAGNIVIEVSDDGKGLDKEKILDKAKAQGLVEEGQELSEEEIYKLILKPGFSTSEEISETSGRGVGMDVVENNISELRGNVEIESQKGEGTTFRIVLPLTLAIIDGMLAQVGDEYFIIPLLSIMQSIRPQESEIKQVNVDSQVINVRGEYIPLIRLHELFGIKTEYTDPSKALVVIIGMGNNKACLLVDDILGQQQVVIKNLEDNFMEVKGISGATILGDGKVALILDIATIIKIASKNIKGGVNNDSMV